MTKPYKHHTITKLRALHDWILVSEMNFTERTTLSGLVLVSDDGKNSGIRPRWAKVYAIGPEQHEVKVGQYVLVSHGRWTRGIDIEDTQGTHTIRRVDNDEILLVSDDPVQDDTLGDKVI
jgi:co-chaperonin GroES (HSP10)